MHKSRHQNLLGEPGVKGLAPVFISLVFGAGFSGCPQAENSLQSGNGFGG